MRKLFSISSNQAPVLITLFTVILLGVFYVFVYIPQNERALKEQHFRSLQRIDRNVHDKISNSLSLMDGLLRASFDNKVVDTSKIRKYIEKYDKKNFTLYPIVGAPDTTIAEKAKEKNVTPIFSDAEDGVSAIRVMDARRQFKLFYAKRFPYNKRDSCYYMSMLYKFDDFIKPLLPQNVFDEYIVFSKGSVVYESFPSGLSYGQKDSLLNVRNGVAGSAIRDQQISGVNYKMFLQPVGFDSSNEWIIGGLLSEDRYNSEKKQLPASFIIFLMIAAMVIVISLPWIKLYQMGSRDRLTLLDGSASYCVAMLLTSMMFFTVMWASTKLSTIETTKSEKNIAAHIEAAFKKEIDSAYNEIKKLDELMFTDGNLKTNIINVRKADLNMQASNFYDKKQGYTLDSTQRKKIYSLLDSTVNINHAFWMNSKGDDIYYWTKDSTYPPPGNFSKRGYYKNIAENKPLFLDGNKSKPFFIEQLVSWTAGTFRTVISIPSKMNGAHDSLPSIAALSINVKSLDSVIMPAGTQFAITDDKGNVLYHYYNGRNLNENLIDEFSEKGKLLGNYQAHTAHTFSTEYYGNRYEVYIKPFRDLPYFLLVLSDNSYIDTRDVQVFGTTLSFVFLFFLFQLLEVITIVLVIVLSKNASFKTWSLAASWLWPKKSAYHEYTISILYNLIIIALVACFFTQSNFVENCCMLLAGIILISICFNALFVVRYRRERKEVYFRNKFKIMVCLSLVLIVLNAAGAYVLDKFWKLLLFEVIAAAILFALVFWKAHVIEALKNSLPAWIKSRCNYITSYTMMAVTRFIIANGIPVMLFYISSFNYEQSLLAHYKQMEFAKNVIQKKPGLDDIKDVRAAYKDNVWIKNDSVLTIPNNTPRSSKEDAAATTLLNAFRFYNNDLISRTQYLNKVQSGDSAYIFGNFFDHSYTNKDNVSTEVQIPKTGKYLSINSGTLFYNFERFMQFLGLWLLLLVMLALFCLIVFKTIKKMFALDLPEIQMWRKIDKAILLRNELNKYVLIIGPPGSGKLKCLLEKIENRKAVYIADFIEIPVKEDKEEDDKGKGRYWFDMVPEKKKEKSKWETIKEDAKKDEYKLIIADHFGYNLHHTKTNDEKLAFLEDLMVSAPDKKVIILSTVHPYVFLDSLNAQQSDASIDYNLQRWTEVLGHYRITFHPLDQTSIDEKVKKLNQLITEFEQLLTEETAANKRTVSAISTEKWKLALNIIKLNNSEGHDVKESAQVILDYIEALHPTEKGNISIPLTKYDVLIEEMKRLLREIIAFAGDELDEPGKKILRETQHTHFLNKLQQPLSETFRSPPNKFINSDTLALKIQLTSQHFYMYIWNSLTKEEKLLLYDLAEDGLVNTNDILNLNMLISKGLIQRDEEGTLRIFNKSFRNFIIMSIGYTESKKIKNEISENGQWNKWRTPLVIVIVAIFSLLIISQQEVYTKVIGYLTVLVTAVIPLLQRLFSMFEKGPSKG